MDHKAHHSSLTTAPVAGCGRPAGYCRLSGGHDASSTQNTEVLLSKLNGRLTYLAGAVVDAKQFAEGMAVAMPLEEPEWDGHLLHCCGSCNDQGWGSCLLSYFLPCVAFG